MNNANELGAILGFFFAQVICSFGMIVLWNPIKRASKAENVLDSLIIELPKILPVYLIVKAIENTLLVYSSYTKTFGYGVTTTLGAAIMAAIFVVICSFAIKSLRKFNSIQSGENQ